MAPCDGAGVVLAPGDAVHGWSPDAAIAAWNAGSVAVDWCGEVLPDSVGGWSLERGPGQAVVTEIPWEAEAPTVVYECPWRLVLRVPVRVRAPFLAEPVATFLLVTGDDPAHWDLGGRPQPAEPVSDEVLVSASPPPRPPLPRGLADPFAAMLAGREAAGSGVVFDLPEWLERRSVSAWAETETHRARLDGTWSWRAAPQPSAGHRLSR